MLKLKWRVGTIPTGRYSSFEKRAWPSADYADGRIAAYITCEHSYRPSRVRDGTHSPLTVRVADYSRPSNTTANCGFTWVKVPFQCATLVEAKQAVIKLLTEFPHMMTNPVKEK
jgi:hypothetical protein